MRRKLLLGLCVSVFVAMALLIFSIQSQAMPNFARKYEADCTMCHTIVPKLNRIGYDFRAAGFRLPSEIGKEEKPFRLGDFFAARTQFQYQYLNHNDASSGRDSTRSQLEFFEFTLYPLTGSWGKYFASLGELSMTPDDVFEVENAYVKVVYGNDNGWFQVRAGIMHPWEGFGSSDRPLGNLRPLIQKSTAIGSPFFLWNLDEAAVEVGYNWAKTGTYFSARVSNGIFWKSDGSGVAEAAQGGGLKKQSNTPGFNDKNYQAVLTQFFTSDSAFTLYYYWGVVPFPDPNTTSDTTRDTFQRFAAYANYWVWPNRLNLLAGYGYGYDTLQNGNVANGSKVGASQGFFGEIDFLLTPKLGFGARYDLFDPSMSVDHNIQYAYNAFANWYVGYGLQFIADYQHKDTEVATGGSNKDDQVLVRMIFIW